MLNIKHGSRLPSDLSFGKIVYGGKFTDDSVLTVTTMYADGVDLPKSTPNLPIFVGFFSRI